MGFTQIPAGASAAPSPSFIPSPAVPAGLTLRQTYTSSQTGLTWPVDWVYVVAAAGGGSGALTINVQSVGGGSGACFQGWMRASDLTALTIGAGGASVSGGSALGNNGGTTIVGPVRAPGGTGGGVRSGT
ncbi:MAG: hypothetical protein F2667_13025, partial [Actinobacteria bacterium]|nr:hypothetical protein [Actinomycetota bacterium]